MHTRVNNHRTTQRCNVIPLVHIHAVDANLDSVTALWQPEKQLLHRAKTPLAWTGIPYRV